MSIGGAKGLMVIGALDGKIPFQPLLNQAFAKAKYKLDVIEDIDAWLKSHLIPILMLNAVSFDEERELKKLEGNREQLLHMYLLLKIYSMLPVHKLVAGSYGEIEAMDRAFTEWKSVTNVSTPHWDALRRDFTIL